MSTLTPESLATHLQSLAPDLSLPIPPFPAANPLANPADIYRSYIAAIVRQTLNCDNELACNGIQRTQVLAHGDLVPVVARLRLKGVDMNQIALELSSKLSAIPLYYHPQTLPNLLLPYIFDRRATYGHNPLAGLRDPTIPSPSTSHKKKVIVEFPSPNIAKEFHAGHLRSTIIGAYICNLYASMGWAVHRINYLGDWGKQFGLLAVGWEKFGSEELFAREPLKHLLDVYARISALFAPEKEASQRARDQGLDTAEIESRGLYAERNAFFKRMEEGEPAALGLWKRFRDVSVERYISTYARLNVAFDEYSGESTVKPETVARVEHLDIAVVRNRGGTTTYLLRDVAAVLERAERHPDLDRIIYVVSAEQDMYFQRVFKTVEIMGYPELAAKLVHVNFGKVQGMSSRLGTVKLLSDILDECGSAMHEVMRANEAKYPQVENPQAVADVVGITAVMAQDMGGKRMNNYPFDITRMTSFEGDTGPYLQYSHARLCSIMRKARVTADDIAKADFSLLTEPHVIDVLRLMAQYPDTTSQAFKTLEPTTILTYLFRLTHQVSSAYDVIKVLGADVGAEVMLARAALYEGARQVLENGMRLLGFTPVERAASVLKAPVASKTDSGN